VGDSEAVTRAEVSKAEAASTAVGTEADEGKPRRIDDSEDVKKAGRIPAGFLFWADAVKRAAGRRLISTMWLKTLGIAAGLAISQNQPSG
jgi:hypothetical protein